MISSRACMNCCYFMIMLTVAILAVERIPDGGGNASYSVFVVFTPFFIIVSCHGRRRRTGSRSRLPFLASF